MALLPHSLWPLGTTTKLLLSFSTFENQIGVLNKDSQKYFYFSFCRFIEPY